jgi:integrase
LKRHALTTLQAKNFDCGKYADGQGLWLIKKSKSSGRWMLRLVVNRSRREMGLGSWPDVSIAEARETAAAARKLLRSGVDPIVEREMKRRETKRLTFGEALEGCFMARQAELKDDGKAGRWLSPMTIHVLPKIGEVPIEDIDQHFIKKTLEPIWHTKAGTAAKAIQRISLTLKHAAALGLDVDLQATMKARALLGKQRHKITHIPSLPYKLAPKFYKWISTKEISSCLALRFLMLTATRTSEVRLARFDEIRGDVWILSKNRTKSGNEHRVPLAGEALKIIQEARHHDAQEFLFPSPKNKPMSDAAMSSFMEREGYVERPHGFRATFRTWVEEQTSTEYEVKETALGHKVDIGIVGAYQRSDRLEKRRILMDKWEQFLIS